MGNWVAMIYFISWFSPSHMYLLIDSVSTYLYPNSRSSPQPPQVQSSCNWRGRELREHPQEANWPSRQARAMKLAAPAAAMACTNAISGEPAKKKKRRTITFCWYRFSFYFFWVYLCENIWIKLIISQFIVYYRKPLEQVATIRSTFLLVTVDNSLWKNY